MIRIGFVLSMAFTFFLPACHSSKTLQSDGISFFKYQPGKAAAFSAHRGGGNYKGYPENCIGSFEWLANQMPVTIECDINMSNYSVLLMMQDNIYNQTTTGSGKIVDSSYAYSQTLLLKDNLCNLTQYKTPTLQQVLEWGTSLHLLAPLNPKANGCKFCTAKESAAYSAPWETWIKGYKQGRSVVPKLV